MKGFKQSDGEISRPPSFLGCLGRVIVFFFIFYGVFSFWSWWTGPLRIPHLSGSALYEHYEGGDGFAGDHGWQIRFKCSEEVFARYAEQQGLTEKVQIERLRFGWSPLEKGWWNPPKTGFAYAEYWEGGSKKILAYAKGVVYFDIQVW
jgi:hypothetical protein